MHGFILYSAGNCFSTQDYIYTRKYCSYTRKHIKRAVVILKVKI